MVIRPPAGSVPDAPGSYQFRDATGRIIYVGKARSLRSRLNSYFQSPAGLAPKTRQMVQEASSVEWVQCSSELEALLLEQSLIKEHRPYFNVRLRDDKSYPWLALTVRDEWPRPMVVRGQRRKGVRYFGPYAHVGAIRQSLDLVMRSFPLRSCSDTKLATHQRLGKPCLLYHIEKCCGPCIGAIDRDSYLRMVEEFGRFLSGEVDPVIEALENSMQEASSNLEFERAAHLRDQAAALRKAMESQQVVGTKAEDLDVMALAENDLEAAIQIFHVRKGRVIGRHSFHLEKVEDLAAAEMVSRVIQQCYGDLSEVPPRILVPEMPDDLDVLAHWLSARRGGRVRVAVPRRGDKRALLETVAANAREELGRQILRRSADHNSRTRILAALAEVLELPAAPLRIECYDMSHLQGTDYVGSMVVMEDGLPKRSDYRRFKVREVPGNDDYAAMEEVLRRRFKRYLADRNQPAGERRRFAYPPQLVLLDGGKGQLGVGVRVLAELGLTDEIPIAALAKQFEEVYRPGHLEPVSIPRGSAALYLLQQVRDEAHRFAVSYHRQLRGRRMTQTGLEKIPGLGPGRLRRLLEAYPTVATLKRADLSELQALTFLPGDVAEGIYRRLHGLGDIPIPAPTSGDVPEPAERAVGSGPIGGER